MPLISHHAKAGKVFSMASPRLPRWPLTKVSVLDITEIGGMTHLKIEISGDERKISLCWTPIGQRHYGKQNDTIPKRWVWHHMGELWVKEPAEVRWESSPSYNLEPRF